MPCPYRCRLPVIPAPMRPMTEQLNIGFDFTALEWRVMQHIRHGRENAVSMSALAELVGISTRELQSIITHLIQDHDIMISSATGRNHGYYYPATEAEYKAGAMQLVHRITALSKRLIKYDKLAHEKLFGQQRLDEKTGDHVGFAPTRGDI